MFALWALSLEHGKPRAPFFGCGNAGNPLAAPQRDEVATQVAPETPQRPRGPLQTQTPSPSPASQAASCSHAHAMPRVLKHWRRQSNARRSRPRARGPSRGFAAGSLCSPHSLLNRRILSSTACTNSPTASSGSQPQIRPQTATSQNHTFRPQNDHPTLKGLQHRPERRPAPVGTSVRGHLSHSDPDPRITVPRP